MGIVVGSTIALIVGVLAMFFLSVYCISKHWCQSFKPEKSSHRQQRAGLLHEMARATCAVRRDDLRKNVAFGPVQTIRVQAK